LSLDRLAPRIEEQLLNIWYYDYAVATEEATESGKPGFYLAQTFEAAIHAKVACGGGVIYRLIWNDEWSRISWRKIPEREYERMEKAVREKLE